MNQRDLQILCVSDYFLPGVKGGGPIRTLDNMRQLLINDANISVFTRDRDLGSEEPYPNIEPDRWSDFPAGPVFYASPKQFGIRGLRTAMARRRFDVAYLNSFFSKDSSILPNVWLKFFKPAVPILIAPRGEFSLGALEEKSLRKTLFIRFSRFLGLYRHVYWHASTELEAADIMRQFPGAGKRILVAADPVAFGPSTVSSETSQGEEGFVRMAFISRISPKKNLDGLLEYLKDVEIQVEFDIFGPVEDRAYWAVCETLIAQLPSNVRARYCGQLNPDEVTPTFARYDLFAFPTHGENFGHVIFEALRAGTPVLLSDQTPWVQDEEGVISVISRDDHRGWVNAIEAFACTPPRDRASLRKLAVKYAQEYAGRSQTKDENRALFIATIT